MVCSVPVKTIEVPLSELGFWITIIWKIEYQNQSEFYLPRDRIWLWNLNGIFIDRLICRFLSPVFHFSIPLKWFLMQFEFCDISIQLSAFRNLKFQTNDILVKNPSCSDEAQHRSDRVRKVFITWPGTFVYGSFSREKNRDIWKLSENL